MHSARSVLGVLLGVSAVLPQLYVPLALQAATLLHMLNLASNAQQGSTACKVKLYANYVLLEAPVQAVHHFVLLVL